MKILTLLLLIVFFTMAAVLPGKTVQYEITGQSRMWVDGTSTIHDWTCKVGNASGSIEMDPAAPAITKAVVTVPASAVDCENGTMNKKVASALSIAKHPAIRFTLKQAKVTGGGESLQIEATGRMELAGAAKDVTASIQAVAEANGVYRFTGSLPISMSEFDIKPPTAMLGTLKTGDDVNVRFELMAAPRDGAVSSAK